MCWSKGESQWVQTLAGTYLEPEKGEHENQMSNSNLPAGGKETMAKAFYVTLNDKDAYHVWKAFRWFDNEASQFALQL